jgi:curli biogenesis system outer membrane secretion channel CsgG
LTAIGWLDTLAKMLSAVTRGVGVSGSRRRVRVLLFQHKTTMKLRNSLSCYSSVFAVLALAVTGQAADKKIPTLSVAPSKAQDVAYWQPTMGEGLAEMLVTEFNNVPNLKVLESLALDDLRAERKLGESGEVSEDESVKKGQWKGADYTFKTVVTRFGGKEKSFGGGSWLPGAANVRIKTTENEVQIDWRIIDNATREVVPGASGRASGVEKGTSYNFSSWTGGGFSNNREFRDSALGKATMKAIADIVEHVKKLDVGPGGRTLAAEGAAADKAAALRNVKGTVTLVDGKEIWISLGAKNGFQKGDKLKVYKPVEKKNSKGVVVATTYEVIGELTLMKVQKDKSMGEYAGTAQISEDFAVADASVDIEKLE